MKRSAQFTFLPVATTYAAMIASLDLLTLEKT